MASTATKAQSACSLKRHLRMTSVFILIGFLLGARPQTPWVRFAKLWVPNYSSPGRVTAKQKNENMALQWDFEVESVLFFLKKEPKTLALRGFN
jgi:hypothetical protein